MNVADLISRQARLRPNAAAMIFGTAAPITFRALDSLAWRYAALLRARGVAHGDMVGISMGNNPVHMAVLLALARLGTVSVPLHPILPGSVRDDLIARFGVKAVVSDGSVPAAASCPEILAADLAAPGANFMPLDRHARGPSHQPWRITLTSGTTGGPQAILTTHEASIQRVLLWRSLTPLDADSRVLALLDLNFNAGLNQCLRHFAAGGTVIFPAKLANEHYIDAIDRYAITHTMVSPVVVRGLLPAARGGQARFPSLRSLAVTGGIMPPDLRRAAQQLLTPNIVIHYGSTETGPLAVADADLLRLQPDATGLPPPWVEAQAVDAGDTPLPPEAPGHLRFRGLGFPDGYLGDPEASAKRFRDGWFYPGDEGFVTPHGLVVVQGRSDDIINLEGNKVQPADVEAVLQAHPQVADAAVFGFIAAGHTLLGAAVVAQSAIAAEALVALCRDGLGAHMAPARIWFVAAIPRNSLGKVPRMELSASASEGTLA